MGKFKSFELNVLTFSSFFSYHRKAERTALEKVWEIKMTIRKTTNHLKLVR